MSFNFLGGVDVPVGARLTAFVQLTAGTAPREGIRGFAGARLALRQLSVRGLAEVRRGTNPVGEEVRVTTRDRRRRTGRLVGLSDSEVVFQQNGRAVSIPLGEVLTVETISHHERVGSLIGGGCAIAMWLTVAATRDSCADCEDGLQGAALMTPVAIGIGAGTGAIVNAATAPRHLLYRAPQAGAAVRLVPSLTPHRAALAIAARW